MKLGRMLGSEPVLSFQTKKEALPLYLILGCTIGFRNVAESVVKELSWTE
jgi:hypothetical protein